ncbi:MAG: MATE family efflux transporter [Clostridiales bacterium]|jgi:putative MATE family efflux protein|nr:MATE family efflux transporter [Clostridiales bacterium]
MAREEKGPGGWPKPGGDRQIDIEVGPKAGKRRLIIDLAWPSLAENVLASFVSMVDMIMVSSLGAYAINAVGLVTQPRFVMLAAFMALSIGSTAMVARFKGARDPENASLILNQSLLMTFGLTALLCVCMAFGGEPLVRLLAGRNISEQTIAASLSYLNIQIIGFPTLSFTFCINAVLRGVGNTRASFYTNGASNLVNVFFNYCLIGGNLGFPKLGVAGASIATVIGQCTALCIAVFTVARGREFVQFRVKQLRRVDWSVIRRILNIGLPALVEQLVMRIGMMLFTIIVTGLGDGPYAAHMVAMNIQQLSFMTGMSFGTAATTLVGQSLGRVRADLARIYVRMTQHIGIVVSFVVAFLLFFGGEWVARLYSDDPAIIKLAADMLKIVAVVNPISNARFVYISALRGAGDSRFAALITFVGMLLVRPALSWVLVTEMLPIQIGLAGVWIALSSDGVVCFALSWARFARGKWQSIRV